VEDSVSNNEKQFEIANSLRAAVQMTESGKILKGESAELYLDGLKKTAGRILKNARAGRHSKVNTGIKSIKDFVLKRVQLIGDISEFSDDVFVLLDSDERDKGGKDKARKQRSFVSLKIQTAGIEIPAVPIQNKKLAATVRKHRGEIVRFYGTIVLVPVSVFKSMPYICIDKIKSVKSILERLSPPKEVRERAEVLLKKHGSCIGDFIFEKAVKSENIVTTGSDLIAQAIWTTMVSAVSQPSIQDRNGRIHIGLFSPPGCGKDMIGKVVALINPIYYRADGMKLTTAGLLASSRFDRVTNKWISKRGYLARAHGGSFHITDVHMIKKAERDDIWGVASPQMENGLVIDSTSAMTTHTAAAAIVADWNLASQVDKSRSYTANEELPLPGNIISRFDVLHEFSAGVAKDRGQISQMVEAHFGKSKTTAANEGLLLKTIVALLLDRLPEIDLSGVQDFMVERIQKFFDANKDLLDTSDDFSANYNRMFKSAAKLTSAHARLHQRKEANKEDAVFALEMLQVKFDALRRIMPNVNTARLIKATSQERRARQAWLLDNFGGQTVTLDKVMKKYAKTHKNKISQRTMRRDLKVVGEHVEAKLWKIHKP
jgi:DNA replicative helicase MCM subunit Mcm2 (Cdc46/Mcm family)